MTLANTGVGVKRTLSLALYLAAILGNDIVAICSGFVVPPWQAAAFAGEMVLITLYLVFGRPDLP